MTAHGPITRMPMMPPEQPLAFPVQDLSSDYRDGAAPDLPNDPSTRLWRLATFLPAIITTGGLIAAFTDWFAMGGLSVFEGILIALIACTFFWISLSVSTVTVGLVNMMRPRIARSGKPAPAQDVALLVPVYNEVPWDVFGNACAMLEELDRTQHPHSFTLFILSDTRDEVIAEQELRAFAMLRANLPDHIALHYRRRIDNIDRKVGNLADWVQRWGGGYDAMLVLDADSLMSGQAIITLTDEMAHDPSAGLIQSFPQLFGAETLFGRVQQFSSTIYGAALAEGLARWADHEGNYWGHNAIIRTAAFASCAGLPRLDTFRSKGALILSHDFVEAGLLRRAGWGVRFMPQVKGSYEEVPATLIDYVLRDRRWCQGNLQHLNILGSKGFHPVTRFHLFHGAMGYLLSPAWFALLTVWALIGKGEEANVIRYFTGENPQVAWPEMGHVSNLAILVFMYGMLLAPKFLGAAALLRSGPSLRDLGGAGQFVLSFVTEIIVSVLYAPILMVQQTIAVARTWIGFKETWTPQARQGGRYGFTTVLKFHALETVAGALLVAGMSEGIITLWLLPIAVSLALAVPLSMLSGAKLTRFKWTSRQLGTAEVFNAPAIIQSAKRERSRIRVVLENADQVAAE
ncbi:membrane glycosyltransferase [Litoreibacter ascidiaceicola]|uniref:Glucans biosynthesis glucosyltransferase H n=1 Tax=Litoreibacter ascidiaceicola TaxID=1486859 RepID=A0A1M4VAB3_9RHOB|nr:glucans biosynthesis glucosyltransferase MdoH [Litoreibacter ascidiaceicola]SHE65941.1 membrane glycosyltransferase [Litoreibacter ascidiaceicola]